MTHRHAFRTPYALKHDVLRSEFHWTAIGPKGLLGHYRTREKAVEAIEEDVGHPVTFGEPEQASWGRWWPVRTEQS